MNIFKALFSKKKKPTKGHSEKAIIGKGWSIVCGEYRED